MSKENAFFKMEMLVLLVLKKQDCYGYEIANYMKEQTDGIIDMNLGTLYPVLYRLSMTDASRGPTGSRAAECACIITWNQREKKC